MAKELITIENTKLILRNFAGKSDQYTPEGRRSFGVLIEQDMANELEEEGIPVRYLKPRHDEDVPIPWVKVKVNLDRENPPKIFTAKRDKDGTIIDKTLLNAATVSILDYADIEEAGMQLSVYKWSMGGKVGKTLYLQTLVCFLDENDFMSRYELTDVN